VPSRIDQAMADRARLALDRVILARDGRL